MLLRLAGLMNLILIDPCQLNNLWIYIINYNLCLSGGWTGKRGHLAW